MVETVYLAGAIANDNYASRWRNEIKEQYGDELSFNDPLDKIDASPEEVEIVDSFDNNHEYYDPTVFEIEEIVEQDKELIRDSDAMLVGYKDVKMTGTPMEVIWAYENFDDYPIVLWTIDDTKKSDLSPWYRYHIDGSSREYPRAISYILGWMDSP